jgi:hypothetical protein
MKVLIMGLPGSGKSSLCRELVKLLDAVWVNADEVRAEANDWDFSVEGRLRQARRMSDRCDEVVASGRVALGDFVCPTVESRGLFAADLVVWMDTILEGRFDDTNRVFEVPARFDVRIQNFDAELWALKVANLISPYVWDNRKPTVQLMGRWQPWHDGHQALFEQAVRRTGQVNVQVRDVHRVGDNPFDFEFVRDSIEFALKDFGDRVRVSLVPNVTNICYGRGVGYSFEEIVLPDSFQEISGTAIRNQMRIEGVLD